MPDAGRIDQRHFRPGSIRPLVMLVLDDDEVRARFAYELTASGFDVVVTDVVASPGHADRPDVIVAEFAARPPGGGLSVESLSNDRRMRGIPVVAVARDVSGSTRELAREEGCAAVCLTTCSGADLAAGIRAVLDRGRQ